MPKHLKLAARWLLTGSLLLVPLAANSMVIVNATTTSLMSSFLYDLEVVNNGAEDVVLVSLFNAPMDALIDATLMAPAGFVAFYDFGLQIIDLIEDSSLFAAGSTVGGFSFESVIAPGAGLFSPAEAFTVNADLVPVQVNINGIAAVPAPAVWALMAFGLAILPFARSRKTQ